MNRWILAARPKTLPAAIAPVAMGSVLAWSHGQFEALAALICLVFALLIQIGTNFANDYYDFLKGADTPLRIGPVRAVATGLIPAPAMKMAILRVFALAFITGLGLIPFGGWWLLAVGAASIASGWAYTAGPYPLGYHGLGEVFVFLFFGVVAVNLTFFVQTGQFHSQPFLWSVALGALTTNILVVNNYRDFETDRHAGKRTLIVRFGKKFGFWQYQTMVLTAAAVALIASWRQQSWWLSLPVVVCIFALHLGLRMAVHSEARNLNALLTRTAICLACYTGLTCLGIAALVATAGQPHP